MVVDMSAKKKARTTRMDAKKSVIADQRQQLSAPAPAEVTKDVEKEKKETKKATKKETK